MAGFSFHIYPVRLNHPNYKKITNNFINTSAVNWFGQGVSVFCFNSLSAYFANDNFWALPTVFDFTSDPFDCHNVSDIAETRPTAGDQTCRILTSDFRYWQPTSKKINHYKSLQNLDIRCFPAWLYDQRERVLIPPRQGGRRYRFSCLNGRRSLYRLLLSYYLHTSYPLEEIRLTYHDWDYPNSKNPLGQDYLKQLESYLSQNEFFWPCVDRQKFDEFVRILPFSSGDSRYLPHASFDELHELSDSAYHDAYVNVVTETAMGNHGAFVSEKTWKPIRAGQFFVVAGSAGTIGWLRNLGFDTFDDIFLDHPYDKFTDSAKRLWCLVQLLEELRTTDWYRVFHDCLPRLQNNQKHFYSDALLEKLKFNVSF